MAKSFNRIDYRLRPAKAVERRMMAEAFLRLRPFGSVETYRYIGMGSVYFSDFSLFHGLCGFDPMISLEGTEDTKVQERFRLNVPLGNISVRFGHSNTTLPTLPWDLRSVVWLDYDGVLNKEVLIDVRYLAAKLVSGGVLTVSVNASLQDTDDGSKTSLQVLTERLGSSGKIPAATTSAGVIKSADIATVYREILTQELKDGLNDRNAGRPAGQRFTFEQVFFFKYQDGAPMLTIGWIVFDEGQRALYEQCAFSGLSFVRREADPFPISVPLLTNTELREINRCDEEGKYRKLEELPLPQSEVDKFHGLRRYWPLTNFAEMT
jgi:hypothetical protein